MRANSLRLVLVTIAAALGLSACGTGQSKVAEREAYAIVYWTGPSDRVMASCTHDEWIRVQKEKGWFNRNNLTMRETGKSPIVHEYYPPNIAPGGGLVGFAIGEAMARPDFVVTYYIDRAEVMPGGYIAPDSFKNPEIARAIYDCVIKSGGTVTNTYWNGKN